MTWTSTATVSNADVARTNLAAETKTYPIPLTSLRVWDALHTTLPGTAANDDAALITGTPGTDAPTVQGLDSGGATTESKFAFEFALPPEYVDAGAVLIRVKGAMLTTVADGSATIDFSCYSDDRDGTVSSDLVTTDAASINSLTAAQIDFTVTATSLAAGEKLIIVGDIDVDDSGDAGVMIAEIQALELVLSVKG